MKCNELHCGTIAFGVFYISSSISRTHCIRLSPTLRTSRSQSIIQYSSISHYRLVYHRDVWIEFSSHSKHYKKSLNIIQHLFLNVANSTGTNEALSAVHTNEQILNSRTPKTWASWLKFLLSQRWEALKIGN